MQANKLYYGINGFGKIVKGYLFIANVVGYPQTGLYQVIDSKPKGLILCIHGPEDLYETEEKALEARVAELDQQINHYDNQIKHYRDFIRELKNKKEDVVKYKTTL